MADSPTTGEIDHFRAAVAARTGRERLAEFLANIAAGVYQLNDPDPPAEAADMLCECERIAGAERARELLARATATGSAG